jgi:predicted oxidoreductase
MRIMETADAIVVGGGLAGLVAATELTDAGKRVILVEQEGEQNLGGQAYWSFGGLMLVNSPEQRRLGIKDSRELAWQDWQGSAAFDREEDLWPKNGPRLTWISRPAKSAPGCMRRACAGFRCRAGPSAAAILLPATAIRSRVSTSPGARVPALVEPFVRRLREAEKKGLVRFCFRHRVTKLTASGGAEDGVEGEVLEPSNVERAAKSSRVVVGDFKLTAQAIIVTSGGIGGNHDLVRKNWPPSMGRAPAQMLSGVPDHVDGLMQGVVEAAGGRLINADRMWHYPEGIDNYAPIWSRHGIRILSGPTPLWLDARGKRFPVPLFPGFDGLGALAHITKHGDDHSWFLLNQRIDRQRVRAFGAGAESRPYRQKHQRRFEARARYADAGAEVRECREGFRDGNDTARTRCEDEFAYAEKSRRSRNGDARSGFARPRTRQQIR